MNQTTPLRNSKGVNKPFRALISPLNNSQNDKRVSSCSPLSNSLNLSRCSSSSASPFTISSTSSSRLSSSSMLTISSVLSSSNESMESSENSTKIKTGEKRKIECSSPVTGGNSPVIDEDIFAKNTDSNLQNILCYKDLEQLQSRITRKEKDLYNLKIKLAYAKKQELQDLPVVIKKWRLRCQEALELLLKCVNEKKQANYEISNVIDELQLPKEILHFSYEMMEFID